MRAAVSIMGWLAAGTLAGWLAWWAATRSTTAPQAAPTIALGCVLLLIWILGAILVWWYPRLAGLGFASAVALPLIPEHALPVPALLVAVSAALAVWSLLISLAAWLGQAGRTPISPLDEDHDEGLSTRLQPCAICHEPTRTRICAACATALGPGADVWLRDEGQRPLSDGQ
jgi:hypothetical protein